MCIIFKMSLCMEQHCEDMHPLPVLSPVLYVSVCLSLDDHAKFNSSASSTFQAGTEPFYISYTSGFAEGSTGYDTVKVRIKRLLLLFAFASEVLIRLDKNNLMM